MFKKKKKLSIENHTKEIIHEKLGVRIDKIVPQSNFTEDLNADCLDKVELIMAFEDEFDIEIPDEDSEKFKTVKQIVDYVTLKV